MSVRRYVTTQRLQFVGCWALVLGVTISVLLMTWQPAAVGLGVFVLTAFVDVGLQVFHEHRERKARNL